MLNNKRVMLSTMAMAVIVGTGCGANQTRLVKANEVNCSTMASISTDNHEFGRDNNVKADIGEIQKLIPKNFDLDAFTKDNKETVDNVLEDVDSGIKVYTVKTMYARTNVHIRKRPTIKSKSVKVLSYGKPISTVVAKSTNGWAKVEYKGKFRYVKKKYLTNKKPKLVDVKKINSIKLKGLSSAQNSRAHTIARICIKEWKNYGVLPSVAIAQAMVESTLGKHCSGNNLWGICSGGVSYSSLESGVYAYMKVINNGHYGSAPFTKDSSSQIRKILNGGYCVPVGNYYSNATWIIKHYGLERFDALIH